MTDETAAGKKRPSFSNGPLWAMSLFAGLLFGLAVYALLFYAGTHARREQAETDALDSLARVQAAMDSAWEDAAILAEHVARQVNGADKARLPAILTQYKSLRPEAGFSLFDRNGEFLFLPLADGATAANAAPVLHTVRNMVHKALVGQTVRGFTESRGFLSLSVAVPVRAGAAGALVVALPLDPLHLQSMREFSRTEIAVIPFADVNASQLSDANSAAGTFAKSALYGAVWPQISQALAGKTVASVYSLAFRDEDLYIGVGPLSGPDGTVVGALVAAPLQPRTGSTYAWHAVAALLAGLAAALLTGYLLHRRGRSVVLTVSGMLSRLADERNLAQQDAWPEDDMPEPLEDALDKISAALRRYSARARNAEREHSSLRDQEDTFRRAAREHGDFLRLFSDAPVGAFQINANGLFIRVNQAFAILLGYDSPNLLMSECSSFTELFLYGDEIRNPLRTLAQGNERQIISLRRRDGRVRHYALMLSAVALPTGDNSDVLEGFLIDREPEEKAARAELERDFAKKQRSSLALLLAATCRQTRSYLDVISSSCSLPQDAVASDSASGPAAGNADSSGQDRRMIAYSVNSVNSVLNDLYQIAMSEAASAPPVSMPMEMGRFLQSLCRQVLPGMNAKGVSLRCEISRELPPRFSGPVHLLRHALERALLAVTAPVQGGMACISVSRDPNAPKSPGLVRVLLSVSWTLFARDTGLNDRLSDNPLDNQDYSVTFEAEADPDARHADGSIDLGTLAIADEQEVLRYLAQRMRGELLEGNFTNDSRLLRLIVPLSYIDSATENADAESTQEAAYSEFSASGSEDLVAGVQDGYADVTVAALADDLDADSLELLAFSDSVDYQQEEGGVVPDVGLDILLVDDNLNNRLLFSLFLRDTRHRITEAHDGQAGVEAFQQGTFDVIFLDMEMPLMDGYQATRIIRALEADSGHPATPIVAMTTYALPEFRRQCLLAGCTDFLSKPYNRIALFNLLDAFAQMKADK